MLLFQLDLSFEYEVLQQLHFWNLSFPLSTVVSVLTHTGQCMFSCNGQV